MSTSICVLMRLIVSFWVIKPPAATSLVVLLLFLLFLIFLIILPANMKVIKPFIEAVGSAHRLLSWSGAHKSFLTRDSHLRILLEHVLEATILPCGTFREHLRNGFAHMVSVFPMIQILGPSIHLVVANEGSFCEQYLLEDLWLIVIFLIFMIRVSLIID